MRDALWTSMVALVLFVGLLGACGGSGGSGFDPRLPLPTPPTTFHGTYRLVSVMGTVGTGDGPTVSVLSGTAIVDGRGTVTLTVENVRIQPEGMVIVPDPDPSGALTLDLGYTEDAAGGLLFVQATSDGDRHVADGIVSSEGQYAILSSQEEGQPSSILVFTRRDAVYTEDAFLGAWHHAYWGTSSDAELRIALAGEAVMRDSGAVDVTLQLSNQDGVVSTDPVTYALDWTGTEAGDLSMSLAPGVASSRGGLGGDVILTAGTFETNVPAGLHLWALTRAGRDLSAATFDGEYVAIGFGCHPVTGEYRCSQGVLDADGISAVSLDGISSIEGVPRVTFPSNGRFEVTPTGALTVSLGGQGVYRGGLVPSGAFAVLAGGGADASMPFVYFLLRP